MTQGYLLLLKSMPKSSRLQKLVNRSLKTKHMKVYVSLGAVLVGFILLNLIIFLVFLGKTYPNAQVGSVHIGSVSSSKLASLITSPKIFPSSLNLSVGQKSYTTSVSSLGISENVAAMESKLKARSWLPIANLWSKHSVVVILKVNKSLLSETLLKIAAVDNVAPVGAKISLSGSNTFTLASDNNGYSLNQSLAPSVLISALMDNKSKISLPITQLTPSVTNLSLQSQLKSLTNAVNLSLTYSYNGHNTSPSASTIASWYATNGDSYELSTYRVASYIKSVGVADGIGVANLSNAVSATSSALSSLKALSFNLTAVPNTNCSTNTLSQLILVSISARHLWACSGSSQVYDSAVVTGDEQHLDTLTPVGTYHIYAKETNRTLTGSDENGSWNDYVYYWMPFLYNQYGAYGFHDATWRDSSAFGNIDPNSPTASNGCVELPLATAQWLYNWDNVGTTVVIQN